MTYIDPYQDQREANAVAALPTGRDGIVFDGRLHPYATTRQRILATVIDVVAYRIGLLFVLVLCAWIFALHVASPDASDGTPVSAVVLVVGYTIACFGPTTWHSRGQSIGKRFLGVRVVMEDGSPPPLRAYLVRETIWRATPFLVVPIQATPGPFDLALGAGGLLVIALASSAPRGQAFYDRLAGTVVIADEPVPLGG